MTSVGYGDQYPVSSAGTSSPTSYARTLYLATRDRCTGSASCYAFARYRPYQAATRGTELRPYKQSVPGHDPARNHGQPRRFAPLDFEPRAPCRGARAAR
eukprot:1974528-Rhodomonas_salina.1